MRFSELKKLLRQNGCYKLREGKEHEIWISNITNKRFSVSRHDGQEVKLGTLNNILKDAGIK